MHKYCGTYALLDPTTFKTHYVGTSENAMRRYGQHIMDSASAMFAQNKQAYTKVQQWIASLLEHDLLPILIMLTTFDTLNEYKEDGRQNELMWIKHHLQHGHELYNCCNATITYLRSL